MGTNNKELKKRTFLLKAVLLAILVLAAYAASPTGVPSGIPVPKVGTAKATGNYLVRQCFDTYGSANGWLSYDGNGGFSTSWSNCPGPGLVWWSMGGLTFGYEQAASWYISPPANTQIHRWTGLARKQNNVMTYVLQRCWNYSGGCEFFMTPAENGSYTAFDTGIMNMVTVAVVAGCYSPGGCAVATDGWIEASNFELTMYDATAPWMDPLGGTILNGWKKGTQTLYVSGRDTGGGVRQIGYQVDGGATQEWYGPACSISGGYYDALAPCPTHQWRYYDIDTSLYNDGCHGVTGMGQEVTGQQVAAYSGFCSDNHAPGTIAGDFGPEGAEGWRSTDSFDVDWTNMDQGGAAPIAKVKYRIGSGPVQTKSSGDLSRLDDISIGAPGQEELKVWLEDEAGNSLEAYNRTIQLFFDDQVPGDSLPADINGFISAGETVEWQEVDALDMSISGIAGYAVSFDQNPDGDPGEEITHPGEENLSTELPGSVPEGESYIHVRAISGAGVAGPINSESIKVDQTKPNVDVSGHTDSWRKGPVTIGLAATDSYSGVDPAWSGSGLMYSVDGGSVQVAPGTNKSIDFHETGTHSLLTYAQDVAGNEGDELNLAVRVDNKPPTLGFVKAKNTDDPTEVRAKAVDEHSGFKSGTLYWRVEGSPEWKAMATQYVPGLDELVAHVDDDSIPEDKKLEYLATGEDNAGNVGSSELDTEGNKYTALTPIKFGSYFKDGSDSGIVFERPVSKAACKKAKAGYRKSRGRKSRAIERHQNARANRYKKSMRRYESRVNKYCGYGIKKKSSKKKTSKASFDLDVAKIAAKRKSKKKKKRCKTVRKDGVSVRICSKKKSKKKKKKSNVSTYTKRLQVGYGKRVWVRGRLAAKAGQGVSGVKIKIGTASTAQSSGDREYKIVGKAKTTKNGVFRYLLPKGGGRHVKAFYEGSSTRRRAESRAITLYVKSRVGLKLRPKKLLNGRRVRLSGRVYFQGDEMPKRGKIVELQFRNRSGKKARWQTFRSIRTSGKRGRFKTSHKFKFIAYRQRIKFRVKVPAEAGWSYSTSTSRSRSAIVYPRR